MRGEAFHIAANQVTDEQLAAWLGFSAIGHDNKLYAEEHGEESYTAQYHKRGRREPQVQGRERRALPPKPASQEMRQQMAATRAARYSK